MEGRAVWSQLVLHLIQHRLEWLVPVLWARTNDTLSVPPLLNPSHRRNNTVSRTLKAWRPGRITESTRATSILFFCVYTCMTAMTVLPTNVNISARD